MPAASATNPLPSASEYFDSLLRPPAIAVPTIALFALSIAIIGVASSLAIADRIPLWAATIANGIAMYTLFSVAHDGSHRSLSRNVFVNELVGRIAIMLLLPVAPFEAVRWIHMQHHRFTNGEKDPDGCIHHSRGWAIPFRWPNVDMFYLMFFLKHGGEHRRRHLKPILIYSLVFLALIVALTYAGYGWEVLFLWFLASRVGLFLIACVFVYLPHYPGNVSAQENVWHASTIRRGWEWLLNPLLVFQNYHLIHHLYPTAPFYTYQRIWHLKYAELVAHDPAVQTAFGLQPVNVPVAR
jgi:beta-carotene hydroxylase